MLRLAVVSHALVVKPNLKRWQLLAEKHPVEVTVLVPRVWRSDWLRKEVTFRTDPVTEGGFRILPLPTTETRRWGRYLFWSFDAGFREIKPDIIYVIHEEGTWIHHQMITYRRIWAPRAKLIFFSMNALGVPKDRWRQRFKWNSITKNHEAALCHYPGCLKSLRQGGFEKPIFLQTQIGVDEELYRPDPEVRSAIRKEFGFENRFVIGFTGRLTEEKGVLDLLDALPLHGVNWALLLVGDGVLREKIEEIVRHRGWGDRVCFSGTVTQEEVARQMQAMDCMVLASRTTDRWIDTFPNAVVQAMATGIPVTGSDSGAIPYQIGNSGLIFPEGNTHRLREHLMSLASSETLREELGSRGRQRCMKMFGTRMLTDNFYDILLQVQHDDYRTDLPNGDSRKAYTATWNQWNQH